MSKCIQNVFKDILKFSNVSKTIFKYIAFGGKIQNTEATVDIHSYPSVMTVKLML